MWIETQNSKSLEEIDREIAEINQLDPADSKERFCKTLEELGELVQAVNMDIGRKQSDLSEKEIRFLILEECADTIQCLLSFADSAKIRFYTGTEEYFIKQANVISIIDEVIKAQSNISELGMQVLVKMESNAAALVQESINRIVRIASHYNHNFNDVLCMIGEKNKKWRNIVSNRNQTEEYRNAAKQYLKFAESFTTNQEKTLKQWSGSVEDLADAVKNLAGMVLELTE